MSQEGGLQDRCDDLRALLIDLGEPDDHELDEQRRYDELRQAPTEETAA